MDRHVGSMRSHRKMSPTFVPERKVRRRRNDPGTEEIIRFVREFQLDKQPTTLLKLQRRAPLPGIGEVVSEVRDSGYADRSSHCMDSFTDQSSHCVDSDDEDYLDNEVAAIENNARSLRRAGSFLQLKMDPSLRRRSSVNSRFYQNPGPSIRIENMYDPYEAAQRQNTFLKQLPPIRRQELPERPSAPSPCITPPLPGEDLDSAGEPVDFIDPA